MAVANQDTPVNTILLQGCRIDAVITAKEFWGIYDAADDVRMCVTGVLNEEVTFFRKDVVGFIDRRNFKMPEEMQNAMNAAAQRMGLAPKGGGSGIVVPGGARY